ncbi:MAG: hypothetical protein QXN55_01220 [Candidatus Nitrosotenuis sp.]
MELFENWQETKEVLLEGVPEHKKSYVASVMETQKKYIAETAAATTSNSGAIGNFQKIIIPMIRRIIPATIATELVGIQPMPGPVSLVYSLRFLFSESVTAAAPFSPAEDITGLSTEIFANNSKTKRWYSTSDAPVLGGGPAGATSNGEAAITSDYESFGGRALQLEVLKQTVTAGSRKLQAKWTIEAMQDLSAQHGLDLEAEITAALSAEIVSEIDNEIINNLIQLAGTSDSFDMAGTFTGVPNYVGDRHAVLGVLINKVANEIGRKTRRGPANWIVVSPLVVSVLQSAAKSVFAPAVSGSFEGPNNTKLVGTLNGNIKVYTYLYHDTGLEPILLGYKGGNGELDAGYFYCPYIPLMASQVITDPSTYNPQISLMTRYGKATFTNTSTSLGNSADYYGKISVLNLAFL